MNVADLFVLAVALLAIAYGSLTVRKVLERREAARRGDLPLWHRTAWRPGR